LNHLAKSEVYVANQLFATLDPTTRRVELPGGHWVLMTDTVGFIQKLPHTLVAAFRATLEEITEADLLIHVVDITHPQAFQQAQSVHQTLQEIGAGEIPVLTVLNKIDRLPEPEMAQQVLEGYENALAISARSGAGLEELLNNMTEQLFETFVPVTLWMPYREGQLISLFHDQGQVQVVEHGRGGVRMEGLLPGRLMARYQPFMKMQPEKIVEE